MDIRQAVLCERLRMRARVFGFTPPNPPTTEDQLDATEQGLGFPLPSMLRALYLEIGNGGYDFVTEGSSMQGARAAIFVRSPHGTEQGVQIVSELENSRSRSGRRWSQETVAALRTHPGSYIDAKYWPEGFVLLAFMGGEVMLLLDGLTGYLYLNDAGATEPGGESWSRMSFCAPSVEDWLERELDAILEMKMRFYPQRQLAEVLEAEPQNDLGAEQATTTKVSETLTPEEAKSETERLRAESLGYDGEDPIEKAAKHHLRLVYPSSLSVKHSGWKIQQARHELLRELYSLIRIQEAEQAKAERQAVGERRYLDGLRPLLEADVNLDYLLAEIFSGNSSLYEENRRVSIGAR